MRVSMGDISALDAILNALINYVCPEVEDFRSAIAQLQEDVPIILDTLRNSLDREGTKN